MANDTDISKMSPMTLLHNLRMKTAGTELYHAKEWKPLRQFIILAMASEPDEPEKPAPKKGVCRVCGCTDYVKCRDTMKPVDEGLCQWTDATETLCTACKAKVLGKANT